MPDAPSPLPSRHFSAGRIAVLIAGGLLALVSLGFFVGGGAALWANGQKDDQGYLSTRTEPFHTRAAALRTDNLDVDLGGTGRVLSSALYGKVRLHVTLRAGKDLFVGIARSRDVTRYLRGTAHASVTDLDYHPFHADYATAGGARRAAPPAAQRKIRSGNWSVVVMNADGSPGIEAGVRAGANVPFLNEVAWGAIGAGALLLLVSVALLYAGARTPRRPQPESGAPSPVPAAV